MSHLVVAEKFAWSEYPGLRPGRLYAGKPDLYKRPKGAVHLVDGPDATETLCGAARAQFPHDFADDGGLTATALAQPCTTCDDLGRS